MATCTKCGADHDDPRVNRKFAERAFTLMAVMAVMDAARETHGVTDPAARAPFVLTSVTAFVGLNLGTLACVMQTLGMGKLTELVNAKKDPNAWVIEQAADMHGGIDLSAVQRKVAARDVN